MMASLEVSPCAALDSGVLRVSGFLFLSHSSKWMRCVSLISKMFGYPTKLTRIFFYIEIFRSCRKLIFVTSNYPSFGLTS